MSRGLLAVNNTIKQLENTTSDYYIFQAHDPLIKSLKEALTAYHNITLGKSGHGKGGPAGYAFKAFITHASEQICQVVQEAEPDSEEEVEADMALTAVFKLQELFDNLQAQFTTTNASGHKEINEDKVMTNIQHTCRAFKLSSTYHGQQKLQISFVEEHVMKNVHFVMEALSKASGLPHERLYGPAPPGQADDKLSKMLQALQIQDDGKRGGKKKKKNGSKAPTKEEPADTQKSWSSGQWN
jgi:hypothetical protein